MEKLFRDSLQQIKDLQNDPFWPYASSWSYTQIAEHDLRSKKELKRPLINKSDSSKEVIEVSKKIAKLDSLNVFSKNQISLMEEDDQDSQLESTSLGDKITHVIKDKVSKDRTNSKLKVLFVTDSTFDESVEEKELLDIPDIFSRFFNPGVSVLFHKMTLAMGLELQDFKINSLIHTGDDNHKDLLRDIYMKRPKLIMSLGASSYKFLSHSNSRLKDVHGQFINVSFKTSEDEFETKLMPIFSPKLLQTAPNMKKTAWLDMQKAMDYLKL